MTEEKKELKDKALSTKYKKLEDDYKKLQTDLQLLKPLLKEAVLLLELEDKRKKARGIEIITLRDTYNKLRKEFNEKVGKLHV